MQLVNKKIAHVKENLSAVLQDEQVVRICLDADFDEYKIDKTLGNYETDKKYAGIEAYEWSTAMSRTDKKAEKKAAQVALTEERKVKAEQRRERIRKENEQKRREENAKRMKEEKALRFEERRKMREAEYEAKKAKEEAEAAERILAETQAAEADVQDEEAEEKDAE